MSVISVAIPVASGALGALFALTSPVFNGALGGISGIAILLAWHFTFVHGGGHELSPSYGALILGFSLLLSMLGSMFVVFIWPRHGL